MTREKVDELLKEYRFEVGRCGHLATELADLEQEIKRESDTMVDDIAAIGAQRLTGMPRGTTVSNPTERIGLKLANGWKSEKLLDLEERWLSVYAAYQRSYSSVSYVNAWLAGLTERERWIVERQVIEGEFWKSVLNGYQEKFSEFVSKDTLKRLRAKALEKIYQMAE